MEIWLSYMQVGSVAVALVALVVMAFCRTGSRGR